jgi:competence protein ComGC
MRLITSRGLLLLRKGARRGFASGVSGFTLVELIFIVFLLGFLFLMVYPHIESMITQSAYIKCESQLEQIRRAKSAYVVDHLGGGDPVTIEDQNVFLTYFPNPFPFVCPRSTDVYYPDVLDMHQTTFCPYCSVNVPAGSKPWMKNL